MEFLSSSFAHKAKRAWTKRRSEGHACQLCASVLSVFIDIPVCEASKLFSISERPGSNARDPARLEPKFGKPQADIISVHGALNFFRRRRMYCFLLGLMHLEIKASMLFVHRQSCRYLAFTAQLRKAAFCCADAAA